jgi:hypothetical protein
MQATWARRPLPFKQFDPITTPHEFVVAGRSVSDTEVRDRFVVSSETMADDVESSGPERWGSTSISPLGLVPWWLSALHVFYDSWVHERDVLLPLGMEAAVDPDEAVPVLTYSLAIVGILISEQIDTVIASVRLVTGNPPVMATPTTSDADRDSALLIDALSGRGSVEDALPGTDPFVVRHLGALARLFQPAV